MGGEDGNCKAIRNFLSNPRNCPIDFNQRREKLRLYLGVMRKFLAVMLLCFGAGHALAGDAAEGRKIVQEECSRCHAIGKTGKSPNPLSPPFREVVKKYPPESLVEALGEGITTGHNEMPEFIFEPEDIMKIVAYLNTLK